MNAVIQNPKKFPHWRVENNLLYVYRPDRLLNPLITDLDSWKLELPSTERRKVITEAHNPPQSGHLGIEKTFARIAKYYYWPGFFYDTQKYVTECTECQLHKPSQLPPAGLMNERIVEEPWSCVSGDIIGPKPPSKGGKRYI